VSKEVSKSPLVLRESKLPAVRCRTGSIGRISKKWQHEDGLLEGGKLRAPQNTKGQDAGILALVSYGIARKLAN
jgi:hypothetical protein